LKWLFDKGAWKDDLKSMIQSPNRTRVGGEEAMAPPPDAVAEVRLCPVWCNGSRLKKRNGDIELKSSSIAKCKMPVGVNGKKLFSRSEQPENPKLKSG
jgi:hypothetical protein